MKTSFICAPKRTAIGSFQGTLANLNAPQLGSAVIQNILHETSLKPDAIEEVYMGCVLTAGLGQAPARQAALGGGLPNTLPCTTIGKVCGSGLKSVMLADTAIRAGDIASAVAGGMESMSQSPFLLPKVRTGLRMGHGEVVDSMIRDGLWDVYNDFHMGSAGEMCAQKYQLTREKQDTFALQSYQRALKSMEDGLFKNEIVALEIPGKKGPTVFDRDEEPLKSDLKKITGLKPVFSKDGTITAANASTLNDGAAAMLVASEDFIKAQQLKALVRIVAQGQAAHAPEWFTTAPALSIQVALKKAGLKTGDIDLWEINEAFSAVVLANQQILDIDPDRINVRGGAVALGHPIGASGARILVTLCHALVQTKKKYGVASLCLGGGEAVSLIVENVAL